MKKRKSPPRRRLLEQNMEALYLMRYCHNDWAPGEMIEKFAFRVPMFNDRDVVHNLAIDTPMHWQAVTISYCEDGRGGKYRLFGFSRTGQRVVAANRGICPILQSAHECAEANANDNHIKARGAIVAPWTKRFDSLLPLLRKQREFFQLTQRDLEALALAESDPTEAWEYNRLDTELDTDARLARLLPL